MLAYGLTADEAFALLHSYSQNPNVKIRDTARLTENLDTPRNAAAAQAMDPRLNSVTTRSPARSHRHVCP